MKQTTVDHIRVVQTKNKTLLSFVLILFLISLFALVSHWPISYGLIVLSCILYLAVSRLNKMRYKKAFVQALMEYAIEPDAMPETYTDNESADGLLVKCGLTANVPFIPGAKMYHILRSKLNGHSFTIAEVAFLRKSDTVNSIGGALIMFEDILPFEEQWLLLEGEPFRGICSWDEYAQAGFTKKGHCWKHHGCTSDCFDDYLTAFEKVKKPSPCALAAKDGTLSFFCPGAFFAPEKLDTYKAFSPSMLEGYRLSAYETLRRIMVLAK